MTPHRPRLPARAARPLLPVVLASLMLPLAAGCGDAGELKSAGATPTAVGPVRLWPDLPPVTAPPHDYGEDDTERVPGIAVPDRDVHRLDAVKVLRAEVDADPDTFRGAADFDDATARRIRECGDRPEACPLLRPYYRDLTGDGEDELIVAVRMPEQWVAVRCYMPDRHGGLTRVMAAEEQIVSVEAAGRDLILRSASAGIPGYEYRTAWSWDERQGTMLPTRDEIVRVKPSPPDLDGDRDVTRAPDVGPAPAEGPEPAPSSQGSAP
ncbi:hypothetical protein [Streptomyces sp. MUM 203J]|uniref:hypothetical protein n=1 Tax=Streptomyces sp. MUM 203J TaxID=2791990 RepID=UPI001F03D77C|nr:hypothetical protein [Streptomyces sp. MUM 203J]